MRSADDERRQLISSQLETELGNIEDFQAQFAPNTDLYISVGKLRTDRSI